MIDFFYSLKYFNCRPFHNYPYTEVLAANDLGCQGNDLDIIFNLTLEHRRHKL